jgi:hypothetical protein
MSVIGRMTYILGQMTTRGGGYVLKCKWPPVGPYRAPATVLAPDIPNLDKAPKPPPFFFRKTPVFSKNPQEFPGMSTMFRCKGRELK